MTSNITANSLTINGGTINRDDGANFVVETLSLDNTNFALDGTDTVRNSVDVMNGTLNINTATALLGTLSLGSSSTVNINSALMDHGDAAPLNPTKTYGKKPTMQRSSCLR